MTRNEWLQAFAVYLVNLSGIRREDAGQEAEASAAFQTGQYGDDPDLWQGPEAAAHDAMTEWHAQAFAKEAPEFPDDLNDPDDLATLPRGNLPDSLAGGEDEGQ